MKTILLMSVCAVALSGCITAGPDYEGAPEIPLPERWVEQSSQNEAMQQDLSAWWTKLNDPILNSLIQRASQKNLDLYIMISRIDEAMAQYDISSSARYPTIETYASQSREKSSKNATNLPANIESYEALNTNFNWELDLFGRIHRQEQAAQAGVAVSVEDYRDVLVILNAKIAGTYIESRTLQKRLDLAKKNVANQRKTLKLVQSRYKAELVSEIDVFQAKQNLAGSEASIPSLNASLNSAINRLAVLLGQTPGTLHKEIMVSQNLPSVTDAAVVTIPRNILRQRPDIRRAERALAVQTAQIGVATAELYPRLSLAGVFGFSAGSGALFSSASNLWSFGPNLAWNVFNAGSTRNKIKIENARVKQARAFYEKTVLGAFEDVENNLVNYNEELKRFRHLNKSAEFARKTVQTAKMQYKSGLTAFQTVLDAERVLFSEEDRLASSHGAFVRYLINIYRAMGGGWEISQSQLGKINQIQGE